MIIIQIINFVSIIAQTNVMLSTTPAADDTSDNEVPTPDDYYGPDFDHDDYEHETTAYNENTAITSTASPYESDIIEHRRK